MIIDQGATYSPYQLGKRALEHVSQSLMRPKSAKLWAVCGNLCQTISRLKTYYPVVVGFTITVVLGAYLLAIAPRRSRTGEPIHSAARSDVQITRHDGGETETVIGESSGIIKHPPGQDHYPGQLRERIRPSQVQENSDAEDETVWQPINASSDTLVNPVTDPNPS